MLEILACMANCQSPVACDFKDSCIRITWQQNDCTDFCIIDATNEIYFSKNNEKTGKDTEQKLQSFPYITEVCEII